MDLKEFDYQLPESLIAAFPSRERTGSRLLVIRRTTGEIIHSVFAELGSFLDPGDLLVLNDTKVFPARLTGTKDSGGKVEVLLIERFPDDSRSLWIAMVDAAKKPQVGSLLRFGANMTAEVIGDLGRGRFGLEFHHDGDFDDQLDVLGEPPLPPYVRRSRDSESLDRERYQTVYAAEPRRSRGTDRRLSFHAGAAGRTWRAGHRSYLVDPACRAGYVSAGADGRDRKSSHGRGTLLAQRGERGEN